MRTPEPAARPMLHGVRQPLPRPLVGRAALKEPRGRDTGGPGVGEGHGSRSQEDTESAAVLSGRRPPTLGRSPGSPGAPPGHALSRGMRDCDEI